MKAMQSRAATMACMAGLMAASMLLGACSHDLFADSENRTERTLRYYGNDSATKTTAERKQSVGSPFGMPTGAAEQ